jgi:DNA helicase-2/ATP-dependent DNA helicase PcrA
MISRIAYLLATDRVPNPKRILVLTFSVNAALTVKRAVAEKLPTLLNSQNNFVTLNEKITVTNYHGLCKGILKKHGYLLNSILRDDVNLFKAVSAKEIYKHERLKACLSSEEIDQIENMEESFKNATISEHLIRKYNKMVIEKLLPSRYITHDAVILFTLEIFKRFPNVRNFYHNYYPLIVVDEFQDTNCIAWRLLENIISDCTQLVFLGDSLQRIYGFIGALPDIMNIATTKYDMTSVALSTNYRFCDNLEMLKLDKNIRANAMSRFAPIITNADTAHLPIYLSDTQENEAKKVVEIVQAILRNNSINRIAILFNKRGINTNIFEKELSNEGLPYFYGMFKDEDSDYVEFHDKCKDVFIEKFKTKNISKNSLSAFVDTVTSFYKPSEKATDASLLHLLDALVKKLSFDYSNLSSEDKYALLVDVFENKQLKQAMEYVDSQVILSTVHGAKGLEWDYVILADVEQWVFTEYELCKPCLDFKDNLGLKNNSESDVCKLPQIIPEALMEPLLNKLCVFYVGVTRAKKQVYVSASRERFKYNGQSSLKGKLCCFTNIAGITSSANFYI